VYGKDLNLWNIGPQVTGRLEGELEISFLQKLRYFPGSAKLSIKMNVAANFPLGFILYDFDKLLGILMLHATFDLFQSYLPQILSRHGSSGESKE
jgi:hypothetical protein